MVGVFLRSVPGAYFNAVLMCFFCELIPTAWVRIQPSESHEIDLARFQGDPIGLRTGGDFKYSYSAADAIFG